MWHKSTGYPSDLTDEQWGIIESMDINKPWGPGRPMRLELRAVINAILYVLRTGCGWRYLPKEYPNHNSVYDPYQKWCWTEMWERINAALREQVREAAQREAQPSLALIDSQSVTTTEGGGEHGFAGNKRVNGRKRHILVDTMGNVFGVVWRAAHIPDQTGAQQLLAALPERWFERLEKILADGGYQGDLADWIAETCGVELEIVTRPEGQPGFVLLPVRWVVERAFAWLGRFRRLSKDYERLLHHSAGFIYLASIVRLLNRLQPAH